MSYNWKYIRKKNGNIIFALCNGDACVSQYTDVNVAYHREKDSDSKFENSIDEFLEESKKVFSREKQVNSLIKMSIEDFRSRQKRYDKNFKTL